MFGTVMNKGGFENHGYMHGISCISIVESSERYKDEKRLLVDEKVMAKEEKMIKETYSSSSTSSSIGNNSDVSGNSITENKSGDSEEVQSSYKSPLDAMEALEEVLPIRRGISGFYKGKSKSFASLADASSVKDLSKPENAYAKRRRNLLAYSLSWDKNRNFPLRSNNGGISKRFTNSSRTTLALGVAMNSSGEDSNDSLNLNLECESVSRSKPLLSRFHPRIRELQGVRSSSNFSAWRSFSLADLRECDSATATTIGSTTRLEMNPS